MTSRSVVEFLDTVWSVGSGYAALISGMGSTSLSLLFMVLSSVVLMFSTFLTPTVNFFMGLGVYIVGVMGSITETIMTSQSASAPLKALYYVMHYAVPNFDKFNVTNTLLHPEQHI